MAHTDGPWKVAIGQGNSIVIANDWTRIAVVEELVTGRDEALANARLIAASPSMLEDYYEIRNYGHMETCEGWCPQEIADAAITKARGW